MSKSDNAIVVKNLQVTKNKKPILSDLNLLIKQGTVTGLIGPSGSGKTTLMRVLVGVQKPSKGAATLLGIFAGSPKLRSKIGYVT